MWIHFFIGFYSFTLNLQPSPSSSWKCPTSHGSHAVEAAAAWAKPGAQARQICVRPWPSKGKTRRVPLISPEGLKIETFFEVVFQEPFEKMPAMIRIFAIYFQFRDAFFEWVSQDVCKIIKSVWCILCVCVSLPLRTLDRRQIAIIEYKRPRLLVISSNDWLSDEIYGHNKWMRSWDALKESKKDLVFATSILRWANESIWKRILGNKTDGHSSP